MAKRSYKLQEFTAHTEKVNCLKIGRRSSGVIATGGDDKKVNMWTVGQPNAIVSLSGHTTPVECVTFDHVEEVVVAGAQGGTLKLWDLDAAKVVRTLTGHRANCISVDFHPYGEFFASGSQDCNLKIWDIRRKGCIHTYKGHTGAVGTCKFSPDGRWLVSGGKDSCVKLWDLTAGKLMHDFKHHNGAINDLGFHPQEFVLATASADRTAKLWDLETFELLGTVGPEATGVRCLLFSPDGRTLLTAVQDSLKVWSWEPVVNYDMVDVGWSRLADISMYDDKLIGCTFHQSFVGVWVVDLTSVAPFNGSYSSTRRSSTPTTAVGGGGTSATPFRPPGAAAAAPPTPETGQPHLRARSASDGSMRVLPPQVADGTVAPPRSAELPESSQGGLPEMSRGGSSGTLGSMGHGEIAAAASPAIHRRSSREDRGAAAASRLRGEHISHTQSPGPFAPSFTLTPPYATSASGTPAEAPSSRRTSGQALPAFIPTITAVHASSAQTQAPPPPRPVDGLSTAAGLLGVPLHESSPFKMRAERGDLERGDRAGSIPVERAAVERAVGMEGWGSADGASSVDAPSTSQVALPGGTGAGGGQSGAIASTSVGDRVEYMGGTESGVVGLEEPRGLGMVTPDRGDGRDPRAQRGGTPVPWGACERRNGDEASGTPSAASTATTRPPMRSIAMAAPGDSLTAQTSGTFPLPTPQPAPPPPAPQPPPGRTSEGVYINGSSQLGPSGHARAGGLAALSALSAMTRSPSVTATGAGPLGLDINAFLPRSDAGNAAPVVPQRPVNDLEVIEELVEKHNTMVTILQNRLSKLQSVRSLWGRSDVKGAMESLESMADHAVVVDVLSMLHERGAASLTLDMSALILPVLAFLLTSPHTRHLLFAVAMITTLLSNFGGVIRDTRGASPSPGVDLSLEERLERCNLCYRGLMALRPRLELVTRQGGETAKPAKELLLAIQNLL